MASFRSSSFFGQLRALMHKNFLVFVMRSPLGFLLLTYGIPLGILALLLSMPSFFRSSSKYGMGSPSPIKNLADTMHKKLVIVRPPQLGSDADQIIDDFTKPLNKALVQIIDDEASLSNICLANLRGKSGCHASLTFDDTPETDGPVKGGVTKEHAWRYTIRADPFWITYPFDPMKHQNDQEELYLPLQLAVNNAITKSTTTPETYMYTDQTQEEQDRRDLMENLVPIGETYAFAFILFHLFVIYRAAAFITTERESGVSQLVDSMGGGGTSVSRVLSWLFTLNIVCLPCFIISGLLYWHIVFPTSTAGTLVGWQILLGLAINSSTVFASSFFTKSRVSSIYIIGAFLLLSIVGQAYSLQAKPPPQPSGAYALSALFPSSNQIFFMQQMCLWELSGRSADVGQLAPDSTESDVTMVSHAINLTQGTMLGFLVLQIFVYPLLAVVVERFMHGIDFSHRSFADGKSASTGNAVETASLRKKFVPNVLERIFCCGKRRSVTAVDGVTFKGHRGQILCLVGPNGSGKTTTLHMISGFMSPTEGTVRLDALPSQIGVCPQRNTFWPELTVQEHVHIWNQIKDGRETPEAMAQLVGSCDLELKRESKAKTLSGGQKRKLQLACMFVGDSSVCLIDECTSGLDPLSRRVIWEILLQQRAKRSIIFTTHFLDEVDVLADHIVILCKGRVKCHGASAELKDIYGGGYKVSVPLDTPNLDDRYPCSTHQDSVVYTTPDSRSAAQLASYYSSAGVADVGVTGPQVEDVFLSVADEPELERDEAFSPPTDPNFQMSPGETLSFWGQYKVLLRKRYTVLPRFWWPYLYALVLPLVVTGGLQFYLAEYKNPDCTNLKSELSSADPNSFYTYAGCADEYCDSVAVAPQSASDALQNIVREGFYQVQDVKPRGYDTFASVSDGRQQLLDQIEKTRLNTTGGIYTGSRDEAPVMAFQAGEAGTGAGVEMLNLWSQMSGNVQILMATGGFAASQTESIDSGAIWAILFTIAQAFYPAAFVLYPAIEKKEKIRSLEYANGVRRGPLWGAYASFDFFFVLVSSILMTLLLVFEARGWNGPIFIMFPILALYGMAAILLSYVVAHFANGPLQSFMAMMGVCLVMYAAAAISFGVGSGMADAGDMESITNGLTFGLYLFLPIGNVLRAALIGLNALQVGCKNDQLIPPGSMSAYGSPILYLIIQIAALFLIIVWIEGDLALFRRKGPVPLVEHPEKGIPLRTLEVEAERSRVEKDESDLMRALHLDKSFGSNHAVNDVTLGLPPSEVLALIGPNGAGKSTLVNMIQSELSPDHGKILLKGEDSRTRSAQKHLGICPQYDALDMMNTRDQLSFYARVKGIDDVKANVNHVMARLNLTPHASTLASKLSGGNKRKLSLAIALIGTPPVLVLDEPTSAMDAVAKRAFWGIIRDITPGRSLLLTTHSMEEADALATRAAILARRLLAVGTTRALRDRYSNLHYVELVLASAPTSPEHEMARLRDWVLARVPGARLERAMLGGQVRFDMPGGAPGGRGGSPVAALIEALERDRHDMGIAYYSIGGASLEKVFLSVVRENNVQEEDGVESKGLSFWRGLRRRQKEWMPLEG